MYRRDWPARVWGVLPRSSRVQVRHLSVRAPGPALTVAFASDLHLGPTTPLRTLETAFSRIAEARPDVLALGGDYVFLEATRKRLRALERLVADVPARVKVAVLGNHDLWTDDAGIEAALSRAGAEVLVNRSLRLPAPHDHVTVVGLDDPWTGHPDADLALSGTADAPFRLGIAHAPEALPMLRGRVDVLLCGHTHGGQVALPGYRPIVVPGHVGRRHPHGRHERDGTVMFVSRGVGGVEVPIRTWAPADVVVLHLTPDT